MTARLNKIFTVLVFISAFIYPRKIVIGQESDYHGFRCLDFTFEGHDAKIVFPEKAEAQRHWIWRARFWGHEPQTEIALLNKGFHIVYIDAAEYRGNSEAVSLWNRFYDYLVKNYNLNQKAVLEGMSRGGLYIYNWGSENPDKLACIYADAPVWDIRSWPGGKGKGAGGNIKIILKEGVGHHPHSLKDPSPIVRFILSNTSPVLLDEPLPVESLMSVNFRSDLNNCRIKFENEKKGRVAFLGGSITYNPGWRVMVSDYLRKKFPGTEFEFVSAGIPSLGSTPGAMRFSRDVLSKGKIDLLFQEAAVNDATNGIKPEQQVRGMEGIIYQALRSNPYMDIVILHFADEDKIADYNNGIVPEVIQQHEKVAEYYSVNSINLAKEVNDRILNGEFTWRDDFRDVHPSPFGQELYFRTIIYLFETLWKDPTGTVQKSRSLPERTLDPFSYINGHFEPVGKVKTGNGWRITNSWKPTDKAATREGFVNVDVLETTQPGATLKLKFKGKAIGLFVTSGPDAGIIEYSIDGSDFRQADQFTQWSKGLHLPWLIMLEDELREGKHKVILRMSADKNPASKGTVCRIHHIAVN